MKYSIQYKTVFGWEDESSDNNAESIDEIRNHLVEYRSIDPVTKYRALLENGEVITI